MNRKRFLQLTARTSLFLGLTPVAAAGNSPDSKIEKDAALEKLGASKARGSLVDFAVDPIPKVRIGLIGLGNRGTTLLSMHEWLIKNGHAEIVALSDLKEEKAKKSNEYLKTIQKEPATLYFGGEDEWMNLARRDDIDLLIIATPWRYHTSMSIYGMRNGKHVACEVPIAYTMEDCWKLIECAEQTQKHCMMMENCCFNGEELWVLNMIDQGVFGEVNHAEGAYIHDLRKHLLDDTYYEGQWRVKHHEKRNGNFYTTHGLGPVSFYMDIGRGDNYDHLVSMSSREHSLSLAAKDAAYPVKNFACGDMNTTLIRTKLGRTIMMQFDVHTGRPYTRLNTLTGTQAVHQGYPSRLFINEPELKYWGHNWLGEEEYKQYREKYDHPLWDKLKQQISEKTVGHGGMDFVMIYRLIRCLNQGLPLDINCYDGVLWSAVTPLSELSVANNSTSINIPDFTGGTWQTKRKAEVLRDI